MFNKDLEEIKKSQLIMNNAITEIKNTLEGTNSRLMEAEDRSQIEDRTLEINEAEMKKEKKKESQEMRTTSETSGTILSTPTFKS